MWPDLWLWLPVADLESDTTSFSSSCGLDGSEILGFNLGDEVLHVHLSVLEQYVELSLVVAWVDLDHSEETLQFVGLASSFLLGGLAVVHGVEA